MASGQIRRDVSDEEFNRAYRGEAGDQASMAAAADNQNVVKSVLKQFSGKMLRHDLVACGLRAIWRCLQYHRPDMGQKFTTSLYRFVRWECKSELKRQYGNRRKKRAHVKYVGDIEARHDVTDERLIRRNDREESLGHVRECIELLPHDWQRQVVRQYYFEGLTMDVIGRTNGYSKETTRKKISLAIEALRELSINSLSATDGVCT